MWNSLDLYEMTGILGWVMGWPLVYVFLRCPYNIARSSGRDTSIAPEATLEGKSTSYDKTEHN